MGHRAKVELEIGGRTLQVSSLEKIYFPEPDIEKAEVIAYYAGVAESMLRHLKDRPIALVRFPEGIAGGRFFQKSRPQWAPDWIDHLRMGQEKVLDYVVPQDAPTLAWLANLGGIEFHAMNIRKAHPERPDVLYFDIDPPEIQSLSQTVQIAFELRDFLKSYGYTAFGKTSGKKGIHVVVPLKPRADVQAVFEASKALAHEFCARTPGTTTALQKTRRKNKSLIDVYRNGPGQTMVAAYSLRGTESATVSMPLPWDELAKLEDALAYNLYTVPVRLKAQGDAWADMDSHAVLLHTLRKAPATRTEREPARSSRKKKASVSIETP